MSETNFWERAKIEELLADKNRRNEIDKSFEYFKKAYAEVNEASERLNAFKSNVLNKLKEYDRATSKMDVQSLDILMESFKEDRQNIDASFETTINGFVENVE